MPTSDGLQIICLGLMISLFAFVWHVAAKWWNVFRNPQQSESSAG